MATDTVQPTPYDDPAGATSAEGSTSATTGAATSGADLDPTRMQAILDGRYAEVRDLVRSNLVEFADILTDAETLSVDDYRDRVRDLLLEMAASGQTGMGFPEEYGGGGDVGASISAFETLAYGDLSVLVKAGVQFGLFGGAVLHLGTKHHHDRYLRPLISGELMGGFAMSESGHGSNVQALRTHATYDPATQEFVVTTDGDLGRKDYIGNAARHGEVAAVFAQLHVGGEDKGVHAFVVPIRERGEDGGLTPAPGVRIEDCGHKMGLNGVDNGRLWFDEVRIPRTALLNRFADVTPEGVYESSIDKPRPPGSSPPSARWSRAGSRSAGPGSAPRRSRSPWASGTATCAASSRPPTPTASSCSSTTACTSDACCRCWPAPTRCTSRRRSWSASCT